MASRQTDSLDLNNPETACAWLLAFNARARAKGWKDDKDTKKYDITDNFISPCGVSALQKLTLIVAPAKLDYMTFSEIESSLQQYL